MENKVYFINELVVGGAEKVLVNHLLRTNEKCTLITIWSENKFLLPKSVTHYVLLKKRRNLLIDLFLGFFSLLNYVRLNKVTSVISFLFWSNYLNVAVSFLTCHKTALFHCVSFDSKFSSGHKRLVHNILSKFFFNKARINIFKSFDMLEEYKILFNLNTDFKVIYNPVDTTKIRSKSLFSNDGLVMSSEYINIVVLGRFHPTKRQSDLIKALSLLPANELDKFRVHFLGEGECLDQAKQLARDENVSNQCIFYGHVNNPYPYLLRADIYISCSSSEGFPNALLEALFLRCKIVHTDCKTGPKEILSLNYSLELETQLNYKTIGGHYLYDVGDYRVLCDILLKIKPGESSIDDLYQEYINSELSVDKYSNELNLIFSVMSQNKLSVS